MKKQINLNDATEMIKKIASNHFMVQEVSITFKNSPVFGKRIHVFVHYAQVKDENPAFMAELEEHEIKFGIDLILNRVEKAAIKKAIELKIYNPPVLVL